MSASFRPDVDAAARVSGATALASDEVRAVCPKCGSPYVATLSDPSARPQPAKVTITDERLYRDPSTGVAQSFSRDADETLSGFTCTAGDCKYTGLARRI